MLREILLCVNKLSSTIILWVVCTLDLFFLLTNSPAPSGTKPGLESYGSFVFVWAWAGLLYWLISAWYKRPPSAVPITSSSHPFMSFFTLQDNGLNVMSQSFIWHTFSSPWPTPVRRLIHQPSAVKVGILITEKRIWSVSVIHICTTEGDGARGEFNLHPGETLRIFSKGGAKVTITWTLLVFLCPAAQWMVQILAWSLVPVPPPTVWMLRCLQAPAVPPSVMWSTGTPRPTPPLCTNPQTVTLKAGQVSLIQS